LEEENQLKRPLPSIMMVAGIKKEGLLRIGVVEESRRGFWGKQIENRVRMKGPRVVLYGSTGGNGDAQDYSTEVQRIEGDSVAIFCNYRSKCERLSTLTPYNPFMVGDWPQDQDPLHLLHPPNGLLGTSEVLAS
jgi:hypothetical protein